MARLDEDVAVILNELKHLREWTSKRDLIEEEHEERIAALELKNATDAARLGGAVWLAGIVGAMLTFLATHATTILKFFLGASLAVSMAGCAAAPLHGEEPDCSQPSRWGTPPVVAIDPTMPAEARAAVDGGLAYWRDHGKPLAVEAQPYEWLGFHGWVAPGRIVIVYADTARAPGSAASTLKVHWGEIGGPLKFAHIEITDYTDLVVAHELGHALGFGSCYGDPLGHPLDVENVMYPIAIEADGLTAEQRAWVQ